MSETTIDPLGDDTITFEAATALLPRDSKDRKVAVGTMKRWAMKGCSGQRLEAVRMGRTWLTTRAALREFAVGCATSSGRTATPAEVARKNAAAEAAVDAACKALGF